MGQGPSVLILCATGLHNPGNTFPRRMRTTLAVVDFREEKRMQSVLWFVALAAAWLALQLWLLPKLGIPT
jgi:hypothetical protein